MTNRTKNFTEDEHFVSQMYLKNFKIPEETKNIERVWGFDCDKMEQIKVPVAIDGICFERDLYEFKNADGTYIARNRIENVLRVLEGMTDKVIQNILHKAEDNRNLRSNDFLTSDEKAMLTIFMTLLILRSPDVLREAEGVTVQFTDRQLEADEKRNIAIKACLGELIKGNEPENEIPNVFWYIIRWFENMTFTIGRYDDPELFTCDRPVFLANPDVGKIDGMVIRPLEVIFPLSSKVVLYMEPETQENTKEKNVLKVLTPTGIEKMQWSIARCATRWLYASKPFTKEQIQIIKQARE